MIQVTTNLYKFDELPEQGRHIALLGHIAHLSQANKTDHVSDSQAIDSIRANSYWYYRSGALADTLTYTDQHPLAGLTLYDPYNSKQIIQVKDYKFYPPVNDYTNKIELMHYCNNGMSYGIERTPDGFKFHLCQSPINEAKIYRQIISSHETFAELKQAFLKAKS